MGHGSYTASDWSKLKTSRALSSATNASQVFQCSTIQDKYNARFVNMRESFDSEDSPESTPIIIGFDVTGSMGYLAQEIATNSLNETIMQILTKKPVTNPHMMCAAFTDCYNPLQVTQFEADIRVVEQLLDFKLGGGNQYAYDNILWYFAAKHTKTDCYNKRHKKGILIGIGDEICGIERNILSQARVADLFGDQVNTDLSFEEVLQMAQERYEVVHIVVGEDGRFTPNVGCWTEESYSGWKAALPGRVAGLHEKNINCLAEVIVVIMQMLNGIEKAQALQSVPLEKREIVRHAVVDFVSNPPQPLVKKRGLFSHWK